MHDDSFLLETLAGEKLLICATYDFLGDPNKVECIFIEKSTGARLMRTYEGVTRMKVIGLICQKQMQEAINE